jgi:uncharacterized protein (TIGR02271 family)
MQGALSRLPDWELDRKDEDVRGWALKDAEGHNLGIVGELIVDTDTQFVTKVVLSDGKQYSAHDVRLGDHVLYLDTTQTLRSVATQAPQRLVGNDEPTRSGTPPARTTTEPARTGTEKDAARAPSEAASDQDIVVPVVDEELEVGTRRVDAGGMRVSSHVVTQPVERDVVLHEEVVRVVRRPIDQPLSAAEAEARLHDTTLEMHAKSEHPVVDKKAHVVEEVMLKKSVVERQQQVRDTVRHTATEISQLGNTSPKGGSR